MDNIEYLFFNFAIGCVKILLNPVVLIVILIVVLKNIIPRVLYKRTTYYKNTNYSYLTVKRDKGIRGEYLIYKKLSAFKKDGCKFLFNIYIPRGNDKTTELDVVAIFREGVFVFESKNYSGWIFGNENQKFWTQVLPNGKNRSQKERFYNPIFQNRTHVKYLKEIIGEKIPIYSVIVFSERCTLKKLEISENIPVINRDHVFSAVKNIIDDAPDKNVDISEIYDKLMPYTNVSDEIKKKHIDNIVQETNK